MRELKPILNTLLRSKVGPLLLLVQLTLTIAIVSNVVAIVKEKMDYLSIDTGYKENEIITSDVFFYGSDINVPQQLNFDLQWLRAQPGVIGASYTNSVPMSRSGWSSTVRNQLESEGAIRSNAAMMMSDVDTFKTLGVELSEGRTFSMTEMDTSGSRSSLPSVVIISRTLANTLFGEGKGLNETLYFDLQGFEVIGIVEGVLSPWPRHPRLSKSLAFFPKTVADSNPELMLRVDPDKVNEVKKHLASWLYELNRQRVVTNIYTLNQVKERAMSRDSMMTKLLSVLVAVLLLITAFGTFGLTLFNISKRTKQIGTRRALGARKSAIVSYFLTENLLICVCAMILGSGLAKLMNEQLMMEYSLPTLEWYFIGLTVAGIGVISLLSVLVPAQRAASIPASVATRTV